MTTGSRSALFTAVVLTVTLTGVSAWASPVIADARADWQDGPSYLSTTASFNGGLGLTGGLGYWNYYFRNQADSSLTLLKFGKNGTWPDAYGGEGNTANGGWSNVSDTTLWSGAPAANELTWHPGGDDSYPANPKGPTIIRWTAGPTVTGSVDITGYTRLGAATSTIEVNGVQVWTSPTKPNNRATQQPFNLSAVSLSSGGTVDFVLFGGPDGASFINAQIAAVPEPATLSVGVGGMVAIGLLAHRRRAAA